MTIQCSGQKNDYLKTLAMEDAILCGLNPAQLAAVTSQASILQVLAPPGSGKTKTLTSRVAYLLSHHGYNPQNVICCTFTIKASREMRERLAGLVGNEVQSKLLLGTFHSICRRYLATYGYLIGIPKGFGIADTSDSNAIVKRIVKRLKLNIDYKTARSKISHHKAKGKRLEDLPKTPQKKLEKQEFITVFHEYEAALATSNLLDYDDLLLRCVDLLRTYPNCVSNIEALLIDEFQDTNVVQFELMKLLACVKRRITIVGDPDQSIYGFRSAEIENLQRMKAFFRETVVINLEENYRSSSAVLKLAQKVIEQDIDRPNKKLKSTHVYGTVPVLRKLPNPYEEALWITSEIKRVIALTGNLIQFSDIAILLRSAYLSLLIEKAFTRSRIPYRIVGGLRFFDRAEIRLIIDYLRTISHPENNSAVISIINTPSRKTGETTLAALVHLSETKQVALWSVLQKVLAGELIPDTKLSKAAEQELQKFVRLIKSAKQKMESISAEQVPSQLISMIVSSLKLEDYLKSKYKDDHEERMENIQELINHASEVASLPEPSEQLASIEGITQQDVQGGEEVLAQFLANVVLSSETETTEKEEDKSRVTISTIHSAKGLEWPVVFVPAVYEGSIPHSRAEDINEERRLLYVAMTRAQALLTLTLPLMQPREERASVLSQFLPPDTQPLLSRVGPLFSDKVVSDMATILRRPLPSQNDLTHGLETLEVGESQADDLWPEDGSQRVPKFQKDSQNGPSFAPHTSIQDCTLQKGFERNSRYSMTPNSYGIATSIDNFNQASTTMTQFSHFSTANMSMSFTTATHQLKKLVSEPASDVKLSNPRQFKSTKPTTQNSNLSGYLIRKSVDKKSGEDAKMPVRPNKIPGKQHEILKPSQPALTEPLLRGAIPSELAHHKLGSLHSTKKRPPNTLEISSPDRKRYVFLSSSPYPEDHNTTTPLTTDENNSQSKAEPAVMCIAPVPVKSRPATTMHSTTMSSLQQSKSSTNSRTLGIRRTMSGWENRKHK